MVTSSFFTCLLFGVFQLSSSLTASDWLIPHNTFRCMHGVPFLDWSDCMAKSAQSWADRGVFQHDGSYDLTGCAGPAGENLAMGHSSAEQAIDDWYSEVTLWPPGSNAFVSGAGHFTAMVWKGAKTLGCGYNSSKRLYVCRYKGDDAKNCNTPNMGGCYKAQVLNRNTKTIAQCEQEATAYSKGSTPTPTPTPTPTTTTTTTTTKRATPTPTTTTTTTRSGGSNWWDIIFSTTTQRSTIPLPSTTTSPPITTTTTKAAVPVSTTTSSGWWIPFSTTTLPSTPGTLPPGWNIYTTSTTTKNQALEDWLTSTTTRRSLWPASTTTLPVGSPKIPNWILKILWSVLKSLFNNVLTDNFESDASSGPAKLEGVHIEMNGMGMLTASNGDMRIQTVQDMNELPETNHLLARLVDSVMYEEEGSGEVSISVDLSRGKIKLLTYLRSLFSSLPFRIEKLLLALYKRDNSSLLSRGIDNALLAQVPPLEQPFYVAIKSRMVATLDSRLRSLFMKLMQKNASAVSQGPIGLSIIKIFTASAVSSNAANDHSLVVSVIQNEAENLGGEMRSQQVMDVAFIDDGDLAVKAMQYFQIDGSVTIDPSITHTLSKLHLDNLILGGKFQNTAFFAFWNKLLNPNEMLFRVVSFVVQRVCKVVVGPFKDYITFYDEIVVKVTEIAYDMIHSLLVSVYSNQVYDEQNVGYVVSNNVLLNILELDTSGKTIERMSDLINNSISGLAEYWSRKVTSDQVLEFLKNSILLDTESTVSHVEEGMRAAGFNVGDFIKKILQRNPNSHSTTTTTTRSAAYEPFFPTFGLLQRSGHEAQFSLPRRAREREGSQVYNMRASIYPHVGDSRV